MTDPVTTFPNHYETLGLTPSATEREIEQALAATSRQHIEEPWDSEADWRERGRRIRMARETLRDPAKRREYDAALGHAREPEQQRFETSASPVPTPFVAAPHPVSEPQAVEPPENFASGQSTKAEPSPSISDPETVAEPTLPTAHGEGAFIASPASNPEQQEHHVSESDVSNEPHASAVSNVAPFVLGAMRDPFQRRDYYRPAARAPDPEPVVESEPKPEPEFVREPEARFGGGGGRSDVARTDEWSNSDAFILRADDPQPRRKRLAAAAAIGVLLLAVAALIFVMRPSALGFGSGRPSAESRSGVSADGSPVASTAMPPGADQTAGIEDPLSPAPDGAEGMVFGTVAPGEMLSVPPPAVSAPVDQAATPQEAAAVPDTAASGQTTAVAMSEPTPAETPAPATESPPVAVAAAPPAAVVAEPARPAPAPVIRQQPVQARLVSGALSSSDNPRGRFKGTVSVQFTVEKTGQVTGCRPTASSGNSALDARTCALVAQKLRFSPAVDSQGRAVPSLMYGTYNWGQNRRSLTGRLLDIVRRR